MERDHVCSLQQHLIDSSSEIHRTGEGMTEIPYFYVTNGERLLDDIAASRTIYRPIICHKRSVKAVKYLPLWTKYPPNSINISAFHMRFV